MSDEMENSSSKLGCSSKYCCLGEASRNFFHDRASSSGFIVGSNTESARTWVNTNQKNHNCPYSYREILLLSVQCLVLMALADETSAWLRLLWRSND